MRTPDSLRPYQLRAVDFMMKRRYGGLLIDMGLGKTVIALTAIVRLLRQNEIRSVLVVAPLRVIQAVWRQEALEWSHTRRISFSLVHGSPSARIAALRRPAHIYLINPEGLKWLSEYMGRKPWPWDMLFVDESTEFSVPNTVRFRSLRRGLRFFNRRYIATGTPVPRSMLQLWSQMYIADRGASLGQRFLDFKVNHFYRTGYMGYQWEPKEGSEQVITEAIQHRVVRLAAEDWLQLPQIITVPVWVELPRAARELYDRLEEEMFAQFDNFDLEGDEEVVVESAASLSIKCRQVANGAIYTTNIETGARQWRPVHDAKIEALREIFDENLQRPMLVPYAFKHDVPRIVSAIPGAQLFDKNQVDKLVKKWNTGTLPALVMSPASAKYGLNMQKGGNILSWFGPTFSRLFWDQTIGRLRRSGQAQSKVYVYVILARNTADEIAFEACQAHGNRQQRISDIFRQYQLRRHSI